MKKILSISLFTALSICSSAQIVPGKLAVVRIGTGSNVASNQTVPVFIDQYNTEGTEQTANFSIAVPTSDDGTNHKLTAVMKSSATVYNVEGMSGLSPDGSHLAIIGYDQVTGSSTVSTVAKVIGVLNAAGNLNTSTTVSGNSPARSVVPTAGGQNLYSAILGSGILYSALGSSTPTVVNTSVSNARSYTIFNNRLYCSNNASAIPFFNTLPTSTGTVTSGNITLPGISNINQIALFDSDGDGQPNIIYAANDGTGPADAGLFKYVLETGSWVAKGSIKIAGTTDGLKSITGKVAGKNILLYAATWGNLSTSVPSKLLSITDTDAATSNLSNSTALAVLATAVNNTVFRSLSFTPGTIPETTLPVKLTSFTGKQENQGVKLIWETASEQNNSHFEILSSVDGVNFKKAGRVNGFGNSTLKRGYSFTDANPSNGINYYKLNQVDFDGKQEASPIIAVRFGISNDSFSVTATENGTVNLRLYSIKSQKIAVSIHDIAGKLILNEDIRVSAGDNNIDLPAQLINGIYIATVNDGSNASRTKFSK